MSRSSKNIDRLRWLREDPDLRVSHGYHNVPESLVSRTDEEMAELCDALIAHIQKESVEILTEVSDSILSAMREGDTAAMLDVLSGTDQVRAALAQECLQRAAALRTAIDGGKSPALIAVQAMALSAAAGQLDIDTLDMIARAGRSKGGSTTAEAKREANQERNEAILKWHRKGLTAGQIASKTQLSKSQINRIIRQVK